MSATAKIFAYKDNLGIVIDPKGTFINDPFAAGQLGAVISTKDVEISSAAKELIYKARREGGSFAEVMLTQHEGEAIEKYGKSSIAVAGIGYVHLGKKFTIGSKCSLLVLEDCVQVPNSPPQDYCKFIDAQKT